MRPSMIWSSSFSIRSTSAVIEFQDTMSISMAALLITLFANSIFVGLCAPRKRTFGELVFGMRNLRSEASRNISCGYVIAGI